MAGKDREESKQPGSRWRLGRFTTVRAKLWGRVCGHLSPRPVRGQGSRGTSFLPPFPPPPSVWAPPRSGSGVPRSHQDRGGESAAQAAPAALQGAPLAHLGLPHLAHPHLAHPRVEGILAHLGPPTSRCRRSGSHGGRGQVTLVPRQLRGSVFRILHPLGLQPGLVGVLKGFAWCLWSTQSEARQPVSPLLLLQGCWPKTQEAWVRDQELYYCWQRKQHEHHPLPPFPLPPKSHGDSTKGPDSTCSQSGLQYGRSTELQEPAVSQETGSKPAFCPEHQLILQGCHAGSQLLLRT
nr:PREDICTED: uncharacterized protein LOC109461032 [Rhinolophus sinicus]